LVRLKSEAKYCQAVNFMTPFAEALLSLCRSRGILQKDLAARIGVESSYLSGLANGSKGLPNTKILVQLELALDLSDVESQQLRYAVDCSQIRYRVPKQALPREYELLKCMFSMVGRLKPAQMDAISAILKL
jgi:transcriptional regulator with XRE-family HTH domain